MSTSDKIVNAARTYRDAYAREHAPGAIPTGEAKQFERELLAMCRDMVDSSDADHGNDHQEFEPTRAPPASKNAGVTSRRPWPDPSGYVEFCRRQFGEDDPRVPVPAAVAAWKAMENGARVMCARGYQWTAHRYNGRLMFTMARKDGSPGKTLEQPWYPLITGRLPVWPIVVETAGG